MYNYIYVSPSREPFKEPLLLSSRDVLSTPPEQRREKKEAAEGRRSPTSQSLPQESNVLDYRVFLASILENVMTLLGGYLIVGYLDPVVELPSARRIDGPSSGPTQDPP